MSASNNILTANDANFQIEVLQSGKLSVVDFWAEWCGPCLQLAPTIEKLADTYAGKAKIFKMNVDENPETPSQFHIRGIPTVILFKNGQVVDQLVGKQSEDAYVQAIQKHL
ncbi:MAG: thioredoxin [Bdellovibrionota bacterium]